MLPSTNQPPGYGLLSRTLIHSPVVKKILPARVRRLDLNDVVFVGVRPTPARARQLHR